MSKVLFHDPDLQRVYDAEIERGQPHEVAWTWAADKAARKEIGIRPYQDGDELSFGAGDRRTYVSPDWQTQVNYSRMRNLGESHAMAEMLALKTFPAVRGLDSDFNKGRCNGNQFEQTPGMGNLYRSMAEAAGVSTTGKQYMHGLAEFPGDPGAWVNGTGDVLRIAKERGFNVQGAVEYTPTPLRIAVAHSAAA
jgi:hypothetical protein